MTTAFITTNDDGGITSESVVVVGSESRPVPTYADCGSGALVDRLNEALSWLGFALDDDWWHTREVYWRGIRVDVVPKTSGRG